jgi:hypothetical protein
VALNIVSKIFLYAESIVDCNISRMFLSLFVRMSFSVAVSTTEVTVSKNVSDEQVSISNFRIVAYLKNVSLH